ncbi:hypothetical protein B296_00049139 [Ensete ventricosum]|uniref:Uncharacterized protein n=1 Tax=Ensete ventricosum TaxID=4639 RepID=A0A426YH23_ENSVE|nr:hypothetical protein B296_00049139 [Ensete ventricosum]
MLASLSDSFPTPQHLFPLNGHPTTKKKREKEERERRRAPLPRCSSLPPSLPRQSLPSSFQLAFFIAALLSSSIAAASHTSPPAATSVAAPPSRHAPVPQRSLLLATPSAPAHNSVASASYCCSALVPLPIAAATPICCLQPYPAGHPCHLLRQPLQPTIATSFPQPPPLLPAVLDRCSNRAQPPIPCSNNRSHNQSPRQPQPLPFLHPCCHQSLSSPPLLNRSRSRIFLLPATIDGQTSVVHSQHRRCCLPYRISILLSPVSRCPLPRPHHHPTQRRTAAGHLCSSPHLSPASLQ